MSNITTIKNLAGQTFNIGQRVKHYSGWEGVIFKIANAGTRGTVCLFVRPDDICHLSRRDCWKLNELAAEKSGNSHFVAPRDHGMSMGNFTPLNEKAAVA